MATNYCKHCTKKFTRKIVYQRHIILCEILNNPRTKREIECEKEEVLDIPSMEQMYNIILELAFKSTKLEQKVEELQKQLLSCGGGLGSSGIDKKKKANVVEWLNSNEAITPTHNFKDWMKTTMLCYPQDIDFLMDNTLFDAFKRIFERNIIVENNNSICTISKVFYIYMDEVWAVCSSEQFVDFIKYVHGELFNQLCVWNKMNKQLLYSNDKMDDLYSATLLKVTKFKADGDLSNIKTWLGNYIKIE